jgi:hypothetical protein
MFLFSGLQELVNLQHAIHFLKRKMETSLKFLMGQIHAPKKLDLEKFIGKILLINFS